MADDLAGTHLMIATDNITVTHYINRLGSTHSQSLLDLTFTFYHLKDNIQLEVRACHIPDIAITDAFSQPSKSAPTEWKLHLDVFWTICQIFSHPNANLFATCDNHRLQTFISQIPDTLAWDPDSLDQAF